MEMAAPLLTLFHPGPKVLPAVWCQSFIWSVTPQTKQSTKEQSDHHSADGLFHWRVIILISPDQWANGYSSISAPLELAIVLVDWWVIKCKLRTVEVYRSQRGSYVIQNNSQRDRRGTILFTREGQILISYWSNSVNSWVFVPNYFIDNLSEPSLSPDLSRELLRVFTGERNVEQKTVGMEAQ